MIDNKSLRDESLSLEALGMICYLRSLPPDWRVMPTQLAKRFSCGRERIARILNELIEAGYIKKTVSRDPATQRWKAAEFTVFAVANAPEPVADDAAREIIRDVEKAAAEKPSTADLPLLSTDLPSTDSTKEENNIRRTACAVETKDGNHNPPGALPDESKGPGNVGTRIGLPSSNRRSPAMFRQSKVEAAIAWRELERMEGWGGTFGEDELTHWHALLRKGYAADDILNTAEDFLRKTPGLTPSLGDWLACFENDRQDEAKDAALPLSPMPRALVIEHHA
jgi:hypothetical protein